MPSSIDDKRRDVQSIFAEILALADSDRKRSLWTLERSLWSLMLALGRSLLALWLARQASRPRKASYRRDGRVFELAGPWRSKMIGTRFGKVEFRRPVGRRVDDPRAACDLVVDRELRLCSGFSLGVVAAVTRLCAQMSFVNARKTFEDFFEWTPSPRATMRMVDAAGSEARPFLEQAPPPADDGEILVIQVDAKGAPMIDDIEYSRRCQPKRPKSSKKRRARRKLRREHRRERRTKGEKSKNAKMAVVGVVYTLGRDEDGELEGPINKQVFATFESHEALFIWLRHEADKRGYGVKKSAFLADGLDHIWRLQKIYFPNAEPCVDWIHVVEKVWEAGRSLHDEDSDELRKWVHKQAAKLRRGARAAVVAELRAHLDATPKTGPGNKGRRKRLEDTIRYFTTHKSRMRYPQMRRQQLDIATGAVEGAVRNLVGMRLDGPGMRWGLVRAEWILHLRCIFLNGQWDDFIEHLASKDDFSLPSKPIETITHSAQRKVA